MPVNVRIEQMQWPVDWPPTASRIASWDPNEHGYAQFRRKDVETTRGKCLVRDNQQICSEIGGLTGMTAGNGRDRYWQERHAKE